MSPSTLWQHQKRNGYMWPCVTGWSSPVSPIPVVRRLSHKLIGWHWCHMRRDSHPGPNILRISSFRIYGAGVCAFHLFLLLHRHRAGVRGEQKALERDLAPDLVVATGAKNFLRVDLTAEVSFGPVLASFADASPKILPRQCMALSIPTLISSRNRFTSPRSTKCPRDTLTSAGARRVQTE